MALIVSEKETRRLIDMKRALGVVEQIFRDRAAGKLRALPRRRLRGSQKSLNVMAAWHAGWDLFCLRAYAGGANTITLYGGRTGAIKAILNAGYLSSLRTGAASGVAAQYLAPPRSAALGLVGPGWQATFQVEAIAQGCPIHRVLVWGRSPKRRKEFVREMGKTISAQWEETQSLEKIEAESDIVVLATDSSSPLLDGERLKEEVLVISMGANQPVKHEVSGGLIQKMDLVVTDDLATAKNDSGDLIAACEAGIARWEDIVPLERIVAGEMTAGRPKKILFQSNGIADEDLAVGRYVLNQIQRKGLRLKRASEL